MSHENYALNMLTQTTTFQQEPLFPSLRHEVQPLLDAHYHEIAVYQDIPLMVDWVRYQLCEESDTLRVYTVRDDLARLMGYCAFFVLYHPHYSTTKWANQDVLYLAPEARHASLAGEFLSFCDKQLFVEGVSVVTHHMKASASHASLFERLGYQMHDIVYSRRLD
jgi:hypothetical protein